MMKKTKAFNVGDKVFAKVKGYPAWPAKIVAASGKKYDVTFYGTMETGSIKVEDLFYYLKHKEQFCRNLKRKDYQEAVEQIEAEIKEAGTDGNNDDESDTPAVGDVFEKKGKKRKRESINEEVQAKKFLPSEDLDDQQEEEEEEKSDENLTAQDKDAKNPLQSTTRSGRIVKLKKFSDDEDEEMNKKNTKLRKSTSVSEEANTEPEQNEKDEVEPEKDGESMVEAETAKSASPKPPDSVNETKETVPATEEIIDVNILPIDYLETVIAYAEHVRSKVSIYQRKTMEKLEVQENEVVIAKLPSNKLIGIKYNRDTSTCDNEYERAIEEGQEAKRILALKDKLENGSVEVEKEKHQLVLNIAMDEEEVKRRNDFRILDRKKAKLTYLKMEASLVEYDCKIKSCLGLDKADPKKAYEYMDSMMGLDISPLMLKKHPLIVDVMKRLRRYIGNVKEWKLAGDSLETFEADAEKIRQKAEEVFMKFISLFNVTDSSSFWDVFDSEVEKFEEETKDMTESELFALCAEPNSRQAFFDSYEDKKDAEKISKNKEAAEEKGKENSGVVANNAQVQENDLETP